jgi:hypothetical protein
LRSPLFLRIFHRVFVWIKNMSRRPAYRTKATNHPGNPENGHILKVARTPFGQFVEGDGRIRCEAVAKSTRLRCRCNAVRHSNYCKVHGGMRGLASRIGLDGPVVAKNSRFARAIARQYDVGCAFALDDLSAQLPMSEHTVSQYRSLSARGRQLARLAARELSTGLST